MLPCFLSREETPWRATLEEGFDVIAYELAAFLSTFAERGAFHQRYPEMTIGEWGRLDLMFWRMRSDALEYFPETEKLLKSIPNCTRATFNVLRAGSRIKPHFGENDAYVRCQLGLQVNGSLPEVGIVVGNEASSWSNGKTLAFIDAQRHEAFNHGHDDRMVFVIDVWRPNFLHCIDECLIHQAAVMELAFRSKSLGLCEEWKMSERYVNYYEIKANAPQRYYSEYGSVYAFYRDHFDSREKTFSLAASRRFWKLWLAYGK
jgi:aspartyl/asparaginyl beta-hydroxylase (cupin superfamily)